MTIPPRVVLPFVLVFCLAAAPIRISAQAPQAVQRITTAIDNQSLTVLHGNVHPLAKAESDQGAVVDAQVLHRMLLLLQRSPEQEAALQQLLSDQQSKSSGRFQNWLTPQQFGAQFGPSDADVQTVTQWLTSQGFSNVVVGAGRTAIEFSGTAGQVRNAFHTEIRRFAAKGEVHFANASDPAIPAALAPVVAGIVSLNNFPIRSHVKQLGTFQKSLKTGETRPLFTFGGCGANCYALGPADFAKIYNTQPLLSGSPKIDGTGQGIAIVGESDIVVQDVTDFRTMFGLSQNFSASNVIVNGEDPGINDSEGESDLDVQWSGAVAPGARIDFVTSASTETTPGINLSALYIVDHNLDAVMSESFGGCETTIGTTFNQFFNALWEQASAQGITVVISAGDNGSAGCDDFTTQDTATRGLAVSGFASTPYNVAVGGTDFDQATRISTYWNTVLTPTTSEPIPASAKSYIPEIPWNDTCAQLGISGCNTSNAQSIAAGSGGVSTLYAKPSWQAGTGVPADGHRDVPDISLFAGNGFNGSFYIVCQSDATDVPSCNLSDFQFTFQGVGGTSASAPAFAGIMALVNQKLATGPNPAPRQGNANYYLYALAQQQTTANLSCNSSSSPVAGCSFNDVTKGNNDVPCAGASTNCSNHVSGTVGVLVTAAAPTTPAFTAAAGYDAATGLGSLNVQNVVNKWSSVNTTSTTTAMTLNSGSAVSITHGQAVPYQISVTPTSASGDASLIATPTGNTTGIGPFTLSGGTVSGTTTQLPGGTSYNVVAHYEGNGTDAPSNSSPVAVTVAPESSKVFITVPTFNPETGQETSASPTSLVYGSPYILRADVTNVSGSLSTLCKPPSCPSGTVTFADTVGGVSQGPPNSGTFTLNSSGFTENLPVQLPGGTNTITATYSGDGSFSASAGPATYTLNVTPAPTQMKTPVPTSAFVSQQIGIFSYLVTNLTSGATPTGNISFFDGATQIPGTVSSVARAGGNGLDASESGNLLVTFQASGTHTITAKYSGDPDYAASTSPAATLQVLWQTTLTATPASTSVNYGQSVQVTATVTTQAKTPVITGTFTGPATGPNAGQSYPGTASLDANGNQMLSATFPVTPDTSGLIGVTYSGDANYAPNNAGTQVTVNLPDFSLAPISSPLVVTANQEQTTTTITLTPTNSVASTVSLQCNVPDLFDTTCSVTPTSVPLNGQPVNLTMTLAAGGSGVSSQSAPKVNTKRKSLVSLWWNSDWWNSGWAMTMMGILMIAFWPGNRNSRSYCGRLAMSALLLMAIGCGGGGSSGSAGSTGGGLAAAVDSTTTISLASSKTTANVRVNATATVTSSKTPTGQVEFLAQDVPTVLTSPAPLNNGSVTSLLPMLQTGIYQIYGEYAGDANNKASRSAMVPLTVTGNGTILVSATNGVTSHSQSYTAQVQ
jgi:Pro-kumamolisin, activation domain/Bacterial Ig-like domain (group 3)